MEGEFNDILIQIHFRSFLKMKKKILLISLLIISCLIFEAKCKEDKNTLDNLFQSAASHISEHPEVALGFGSQLIEDARRAGNNYWMAKGLNLKGYILKNQRIYKEAMVYFQEALGYASDSSFRAIIYANMAWTYHLMTGRKDEAFYHINRAVALSVGGEKVEILGSQGSIYLQNFETDSALIYLEKSYEISHSDEEKAISACDLGYFYLMTQDLPKADFYLDEAFRRNENSSSSSFYKSNYIKAQINANRGHLSYLRGSFDQAIDYLEIANKISRQQKIGNALEESTELLKNVYLARDDSRKVNQFGVELNEITKKNMAQQATVSEYLLEQKNAALLENEKTLLEKEKTKSRLILIVFASVVLLIVGFFVIRYFWKKNKEVKKTILGCENESECVPPRVKKKLLSDVI